MWTNKNGIQKVILGFFTGIYCLAGSLIMPGLAHADDGSQKFDRAISYFNSGLDPLVDNGDQSLHSCAVMPNAVGATAAGAFGVCAWAGPFAPLCLAGIASQKIFDPAIAEIFKSQIRDQFSDAMKNLQAHPDQSNQIVSDLTNTFSSTLNDGKFGCADVRNGIDDLNRLAASTMLAYLMAPGQDGTGQSDHALAKASPTELNAVAAQEGTENTIPSEETSAKSDSEAGVAKCLHCGLFKTFRN